MLAVMMQAGSRSVSSATEGTRTLFPVLFLPSSNVQSLADVMVVFLPLLETFEGQL